MQIAALLPAAAALYAPCISAADTPRDLQVLQEIIVTATKRTERLQDVPISVSAITGEDIQARGFTNYADYLNTVPGVYFQDCAGPAPRRSAFAASALPKAACPPRPRPISARPSPACSRTRRQAEPAAGRHRRVEVLRGPQGTLFGASALAGVVRIIPNAPNLQEFEANVGMRGFTTAHSDDESYHVEGAVNIPLVTDKLALRWSAIRTRLRASSTTTFAGQAEIGLSEHRRILGLPDGTLVSPAVAAIHAARHQFRGHLGRRGRADLARRPTT